MSTRAPHFITEAFLTRWLDEAERNKSNDRFASIPVTRLCHPLRSMLAITSSNLIVGLCGGDESRAEGRGVASRI